MQAGAAAIIGHASDTVTSAVPWRRSPCGTFGLSDLHSTHGPDVPIPIKTLAKLVRGKFRAAALPRKRPGLIVSHRGRTRRIFHVTASAAPRAAILDYLPCYFFRISLANALIVSRDDKTIIIQHMSHKAGRRYSLQDCRGHSDGERHKAIVSTTLSARRIEAIPRSETLIGMSPLPSQTG